MSLKLTPGVKFTSVAKVQTVKKKQSKLVAFSTLTLILLTWRIWRAPNNASRWQMGFNSVFKGLIVRLSPSKPIQTRSTKRN